ncbi:TonB-dependent receptor plug domain-containing protein [Sphingomonas hengshuiensis]|uniref:TonB-dependent receptor plug domain-containing protein n=1 Tax=Sphingomonas hengshuiensis TaxID=1609977 RepID=UPI0009821AC4|nr:TonB-dependent receptor [Sphingomonas hengshuiensis]
MHHSIRVYATARFRLGASLAAITAVMAAGAASAQQQDVPAATPVVEQAYPSQDVAADQTRDETDAIVVTGSRLARSGFTAPTPVTVLGAEQMERQGVANVAQVLAEIPAFRAQSSPTTSAIFVSNLGAATADLRGLGGNRTLVLVDGRRVVASTVSGGSFTPANTVDLNLVPASLLERVEVVTGGASAAYGSDAVGGVVNLIINRNLIGLKATAQYGITERGDGAEFMGSLAYGTRFAGDRGRFIIGAEYVDNRGTGDCYTRKWCAESYNTVSNPFRAGSTTERVIAGQAATLILPNARTATASLNGLVISGPLRGTSFNANGTTFAHNYGTYGGAGLFQSGGGDSQLAFYEYFPIAAPAERINVFSNLDYELADNFKVFAQGSYGRVHGEVQGSARRDISPAGAYQIRRDNAFLPASVVSQMVTAGVQTLAFGRIWNDIGPQLGEVTRETYRFVGGFEYGIGAGLTIDGYYQYGRTDYSQRGYNTTVNSRMGFAVDAVRDGSGNIVCRATLPGASFNAAAAGCVPLNPFGNGASSAAARDYVTETVMQDTVLDQHVAALTLRGNLVELWAGPIAFAVGGEYRRDGVSTTIDAISAANNFFTSPGGGIDGGTRSLDVKEGFVEVAIPLARDMTLLRSLELNGAARVTDYSNSGQVETWKVGVNWEPTDFLRFRGTRSRDIRAPNLFELFTSPQNSFQTVDDPRNGGARVLVPTLLQGNATLQPEVADTWTAGGVITARMGSAGTFRASLDWFDINLAGAISTLGAQVIVNRCNTGDTALCSLITRDSGGTLTRILNANLNLNTLITRGWDIEADYNLPLGNGNSIGIRALATVVKDLITVDTAGVAIDRAGQNGSGVSQPSGLPDYTINGFLTYQGNPFSAQLQLRHISGGRYSVTNIGPDEEGYSPLLANSISNNRVPAVTYVNLNFQLKVNPQFELFTVVNNLLDKDPPNNLPSSFGPTNPVLYDVLGRSYRAGVRLTF